MSKIFKLIPLIFLFFALTAQEGCQTTGGMKKISAKQNVKQDMVAEIQTEIMGLGETPLTKDEAKYKGLLGNDKYIKALKEQLAEVKKLKEAEKQDSDKKLADAKAKKEKEDADAKAKKEKEDADAKIAEEKAKKEKIRAKAIQDVKKEILFLGETPMPEYEFTSEDKYIAALRKQIEEIKKIKEEEEAKINAEIPEWYINLPSGSEMVMYARGTADSADLDNSETMAIENAKIKLAANLKTRIDTKTNIAIKQAGVDNDETFKRETKRVSSIVVKDVTLTGYKIYKTKMAPLSNGKFRTFIIVEFPISLAYKAYLANIENNPTIKENLSKLKNTEAYKELEQSVAEFTGA